MSLFGGSGPNSPHGPEVPEPDVPEPTQPESAQPGPSKEEAVDSQSAQPPPNLNPLLTADVGSDIDAEGETDSDAFHEPQLTRPNRFIGPRQTWKGYTAGERQIVASLEQIENSDLAAHLYNAHALKRRARRSARGEEGLQNWQSKERWLKPADQLKYKDTLGLTQTQLIPSNDWTAWPRRRVNGSAPHHQFSTEVAHAKPGEWMIGGAGEHDAGDELRDELLATFLRLARQKWDSRTADNNLADALSTRSRSQSRSKSRSKSVTSKKTRRSASHSDFEDIQDAGDASDSTTAKKGSRKPQVDTSRDATILTDDAQAQKLLQPTIQSILNQLDHVALGVRRMRLNHLGFGGQDGMSSYSEYTTDVGTDRSMSRASAKSKSKSRRRSKSTTTRKRGAKRSSQPPSGQASSAKGKRKKAPEDLLEESDSDVPMQSSSDSAESQSNTHIQKQRRSASISSDDSFTSSRDSSGRKNLMDWSEVLGVAAVKGWDAGALARTAQRCAALFGESMSFIPLEENTVSNPIPEPVQFTPSTIPAPDALSAPRSTVSKRPYFRVGTRRCPHVGCYGHKKEFKLAYRVVQHCMSVHGYDPRTNNDDNEDNKLGAVHIDGFMLPVTQKQGWIGFGRAKANKKIKIGEADEPVAVDVIPSIEDQIAES